MARIGIMGGTFNPIHIAHIEMAEMAVKEMKLDKVVFLPDGTPPHKTAMDVISDDRLQMVKLALEKVHDFQWEIDERELKRSGYTYTVDTMREFIDENADNKYVLIIGADSLLNISSWMKFEELLSMCRLYAVLRNGSDEETVKKTAKKLKNEYGAKVKLSSKPVNDYSSTAVREAVNSGDGIWKTMVNDEVADYIIEKELYHKRETTRFEELYVKVMEVLDPDRWHHTLGVIDAAEAYAVRFGADVEKAKLAALLHDCAKPYKGKKGLEMIEKYGLLDEESFGMETYNTPTVWHGPIGAKIAELEYNVTDREILDAIYFHTTGRADMSLMEKVIKLADLTERGRDYPGVDKIREIAKNDLEAALLMSMERTIDYVASKGKATHSLTYSAMDYLRQTIQNRK